MYRREVPEILKKTKKQNSKFLSKRRHIGYSCMDKDEVKDDIKTLIAG